MRKILFRPIDLFLLVTTLSVILSSCTKPDTGRVSTSFTWTVGGVTYTSDEVSGYYFSNTIIAEKDLNSPTDKKHLEILLAGFPGPGFVQGDYTLTSGGGNILNYGVGTTPPSAWPYSVSGTLTISSKAGDVISGSFNAILNGANGPISGTFTNVSID